MMMGIPLAEMPDMPAFEAARDLILARVATLPAERVPLYEAAGRVLAEDLVAPWDMPRWDNSAMDGYAVRSEDCAGCAELRLTGYRPAGEADAAPLEPGCAMRIMTGAPLPAGADAVVPIEDAAESGGRVRFAGPVAPRAHVRFKGEDVRTGERIISSGTLLGPPEINMLASCGNVLVSVFRRARVAILATGDELVEPGEPLAPGKVINSNSVSISAAVREAGGVPLVLGIARDDRDILRAGLAEGLKADALVTTAGVSVGDRDLVRDALRDLSVEEIFWKIDVKPGRPTAFGMKDGKPVFSLPGNPVSGMVTFEMFVRPALLKMMGHARPVRPLVKAALSEAFAKKAGRVMLLRVRVEFLEGRYVAAISGDQKTGIVRTMLRANGIAILGADRTAFRAGEAVDVHLLDRRIG